MKRKLLIIFIFFLIGISSYAVDFNSLDKYIWIEQVLQTRGGYTSFIKLEKIPEKYEIYKMKYHNCKTNNILFFVFYYNFTENKFYKVENVKKGMSSIPLFKFNNLDCYMKTEGNENSLEGKYYSDIEEYDEIEIKKVEKKDYLYAIYLDYEERGLHFLYLEGNTLKSDNTFGLCNEKTLEELFSVDRSESYYNNRNILSTYSNDNFSIYLTKNEEFDIELELKSDIQETYLIPEALYINKYVYLYQDAEIFDDNLDFIRKQNRYREEVLIIDRKNKWIERNGLMTMFIKVKFSDGTTGWIYSDKFIIF